MLESLKNKRILILAAHPDDETLSMGGTIARLSENGCKIRLITFTDGTSSRGKLGNRNVSLERVSEILGIDSCVSGKFPDNALDSVPLLEVVKFIENNVEDSPDIIFTHSIDDLNVDHQIVFKATLTAFRPQNGLKHKIYSFFVPSATDYNPLGNFRNTTYVEISDEQAEKKVDALKVYHDEMRPHPHTRSYKNIKNISAVLGSQVGIPFCEGFQLIREVL